jgi:hypothetical protein
MKTDASEKYITSIFRVKITRRRNQRAAGGTYELQGTIPEDFFFIPALFANCTSTFSKWCEDKGV